MRPVLKKAATQQKNSVMRKILFSLITTIGFFSLLEVTARIAEVWFPTDEVDYGLGFDPASRVFVPSDMNPQWMVTAPTKRRFFLSQTFPASKPPRTLRVVALGESSVNYLQSELEILRADLAETFRERYDQVEMINCGGLSYGTHRLLPVLIEMLAFKPDLVLIYIGHNEFEEVEQRQLADLDRLILNRNVSKLAFVRYLRDAWTRRQVASLRKQHQLRIDATSEPIYEKAWKYQFTEQDVAERMQAYRTNLTAMVELCRLQKVLVVVGTVPSNLLAPRLPDSVVRAYLQVFDFYRQQRYMEAANLGRKLLRESPGRHQSSDLENNIIRSVAVEHDVPLADIEAAVIRNEPHHVPGESLFLDHCHLNSQGNVIWRKIYEETACEALRQKLR